MHIYSLYNIYKQQQGRARDSLAGIKSAFLYIILFS